MSRPSATVAGVFSDSEMIHRTGNRAKTRTMTSAATHRPILRSMSDHLSPLVCRPKPLMKNTAMIATQMKISTDIADPNPRFNWLSNWL